MNETLTPPQLARRWGVAADKVLALIHSGQLRAVNLAVKPSGRPRYRIYQSEVERFERSRTAQPPVPTQRRRRRTLATVGKQYF